MTKYRLTLNNGVPDQLILSSAFGRLAVAGLHPEYDYRDVSRICSGRKKSMMLYVEEDRHPVFWELERDSLRRYFKVVKTGA